MSDRQSQLKVLLTRDEQRQIRELAEWHGLDVSNYVRQHIKMAHRELSDLERAKQVPKRGRSRQ